MLLAAGNERFGIPPTGHSMVLSRPMIVGIGVGFFGLRRDPAALADFRDAAVEAGELVGAEVDGVDADVDGSEELVCAGVSFVLDPDPPVHPMKPSARKYNIRRLTLFSLFAQHGHVKEANDVECPGLAPMPPAMRYPV